MNLLFDIGGTHTRLATSDGEKLLNIKTYATPQDFDQAILLFGETAKALLRSNKLRLLDNQKIDLAVGGVRGPLDKDKTHFVSNSRLPQWVNKPLKKELEKAIHAPVCLQNDAALAGLAEAIKGAGSGYKTVGFLTIGTGVGGVRIVDGKVDEESVTLEPGHSIIIGGKELENLISGPAIKESYGENPNWDEICRNLSLGLNTLVDRWSPDIFILGGGVVNSLPFQKLKVAKTLRIVKASLGDSAGLYGALEYLRQLGRL